ncbi:MAG: CinA family protein [Chitinispirillia bacterium]|nr:CinA family protein [Chitinispirillia bacterium]
MESIMIRLGEILKSRGLTLAVAESCTGGLLGGAITSVAGSSSYFRGGVIAYDNDIKRGILGVPAEDLETYGAVSDPVVKAMAGGAAELFGAGCAVSVSGIAGPGGGSDEKPVGLVFIGVFYNGRAQSRSFAFKGNREDVRSQSVDAALEFLADVIK